MMARQFPIASRAMGIMMPRCGLKVSRPNITPARMDRRGSSVNPDRARAAVKNPFWPRKTFTKLDGASNSSQGENLSG